jgi:hypothetical protein
MNKLIVAIFGVVAMSAVIAQSVIPIGKNRECFFDDCLLDKGLTSAELRLHRPVLRGPALIHDAEWEGSCCNYHNLFFDDAYKGVDGKNEKGTYRLYYLGWQTPPHDPSHKPDHPIVACYAESADGITWIKPSTGIPYGDHRDTNIVLAAGVNHTGAIDNFMVFRDDNPACAPEVRYKGVGVSEGSLRSYLSADGIHFTEGDIVTSKGAFGTLNVVFWDAMANLYRGYIRNFVKTDDPSVKHKQRYICYMESKDFKTWTDPVLLSFADEQDIPLYTNMVVPYLRAPQIYIGFPTRYIERHAWNGSFEEMGGKDFRRKRMEIEPRFGLTITDCMFMVSRDGRNFTRYLEAFLRPEIENNVNWVYGDCFPARGFAVTPNPVPGAPDELSLYVPTSQWMQEPSVLNRYSIRMDGFVSIHADGSERIAATKVLTYDGSDLFINFETSAMGYLFVTLTDAKGKRFASCETFGNALDRRVVFDDPEAVKANSGKPVTIEFRLRDADVYSMQFK